MTPTLRWIFLLFLIRTSEVKCVVILTHCDADGEYYWTSEESAVENPVFKKSTLCSFSDECFMENCALQTLVTAILSDGNCSRSPPVLKHLQPNKPVFVDNVKSNILIIALQKNCSRLAEELLAIDADPYLQDSWGDTSLHMAVRMENIPIVLLILQNNKAGINKQNALNETALILASKLNNSEIFRIILKGNADPLIWASDKYTPLHFASMFGNTEIASAVLQKNRWFINLQAAGGFTPLFLAVENNQTHMCSFLLESGALPYLPSDRQGTALHAAVRVGNIKTAERILKKSGGGVNFVDSEGCTAILLAARRNLTDLYYLLLDAGADPFLPSYLKRTALHEAVENGNLQIIEVTLKKTTKGVNQQDLNGVSALLIAARQNNQKIAEILLKSGSDPSIADYENIQTPLHLCAENGDLVSVKRILKQVPSIINTIDKNSQTPLYIATINFHIQVAIYLLSRGADVSISDEKMWTPLHVSANINLPEIAEAILRSNKAVLDMQSLRGHTALHVAVAQNAQDVMSVLVQNKAAILPDMFGLTPLHYAAGMGSVPLLSQLLEAYGNFIDIEDFFENTPLHEAASHNMTETAVLLLESGAKTNTTNNVGETPLHYAVRMKNERLVLCILIHSNPNVISITNNNDDNSLVLAFLYNYNIFKMILNRCPSEFVTLEVLDSLFYAAASFNQLEELKLILERFPESIHFIMSSGYNVLHYAVLNCYEDMIYYLLKKGADVISLSAYEKTPLHIAASYCGFSVFHQLYDKSEELLMTKNSSIKYILDQPDIMGLTPIHWAAVSGNKEIFNFLWREGENSDSSARGYLFLAARGGNTDIIQDILRKSNGPVDLISSDGSTPLMYAALSGSEDAFNLLLANGAQLGVTNKYGRTILHSAASSRHDSTVIDAVLKQRDINVNVVDVEGYTPLMIAAVNKNLHALQELLLREADQDIVNIYDETAVTLAVKNGFWKALESLNYGVYDSDVLLGIALGRKVLPKKGVLSDFLAKSSISKDPLFYAAAVGEDLEVQKLLARSERIKRRRFPLIFKEFLKEYIEYMLQFEDYDSDPLYEHHVSLLDISLMFSENLQTVRRIVAKTGVTCSSIIYREKMFTPIDFAIFNSARNQNAFSDSLLDYMFDICNCCLHQATNKHGWGLAHKAAWLEDRYALGILKRRGVDLDKPDAYGRTPLHVAAIRGNFDTVKQILVFTKKSVNASDIYGFIPLHLALMYKYGGFFKRLSTATISMPPSEKSKFIQKIATSVKSDYDTIVRMLLKHKSPLGVQDKAFGWTPLHWAAVNGDETSAALLVYYGARLNIPSWTGQTPMAVARTWGRTKMYDYLKKKNGVW